MLTHSSLLTELYCSKNLKVVRLHGLDDSNTCLCYKGQGCGSPGKHPVEKSWGASATSDADVCAEWDENGQPHNIGLLLGPKGGIVDIECDDEEAKKAWDALELDVVTPTYSSGRGPHRIFLWDDRLPDEQIAKPLGIECRIGGGNKQTQSVCPPSKHHTGKVYQWLPGLSPEDVEFARLPQKLVDLINNYVYQFNTGNSMSTVVLKDNEATVAEGGRNDAVYKYACSVFGVVKDQGLLNDTEVIRRSFRQINERNQQACRPPLDPREVQSACMSALKYVNETALIDAENDLVNSILPTNTNLPLTYQQEMLNAGLTYEPVIPGDDPEWGAGDWYLMVVHADPWFYELHIPRFQCGAIKIDIETICSPPKVARAILSETKTVPIDRDRKQWALIWNGGNRIRKAGGQMPATGLRDLLLSQAQTRVATPDEFRLNELIQIFVSHLQRAQEPTPDDSPDPDGNPRWRSNSELWFCWQPFLRMLMTEHREMQSGDAQLISEVICEVQERDTKRTERHGGKRYTILSSADLEKLRSFESGAEPPHKD